MESRVGFNVLFCPPRRSVAYWIQNVSAARPDEGTFGGPIAKELRQRRIEQQLPGRPGRRRWTDVPRRVRLPLL